MQIVMISDPPGPAEPMMEWQPHRYPEAFFLKTPGVTVHATAARPPIQYSQNVKLNLLESKQNLETL